MTSWPAGSAGPGPSTRPGSPLAALRRVATAPAPRPGERCEMCAEPIDEPHQHVVSLRSRQLMCTCRACYLLFADQDAELSYRSVPDRYLSFPTFRLDPLHWNDLQIPVGLAFLFDNSMLGRTVAFYPGPAGATESELPLSTWEIVVAANPQLRLLRPDVEALLIRAPSGPGSPAGPIRSGFDCYLVPIDACYELVGRLRQGWRGFDGGTEARALIEDFFDRLAERCRPAPDVPSGPQRSGSAEVPG